MLKSLVST